MANRNHVQVYVRVSGNQYEWRRVRPTRGDPYVFTQEQAEQYIRTQAAAYGDDPKNWRIEELPV